MSWPRCSGILLHPTCLPGAWGIGDLGNGCTQWVDFLAQAEQRLWQILPLGPTGYGNSPYLSYSAMAGNPLVISLELLQKQGMLPPDLVAPDLPRQRVDYDGVYQYKLPQLRLAWAHFQTDSTGLALLREFQAQQAHWLPDFSLFMALKDAHAGQPWYAWEPGLAWREPDTLAQWRQRVHPDQEFHSFLQYIFWQQWQALHRYAQAQQVRIVGDLPIYVAHDSADVWANPDLFAIDQKTGAVALMAGVPPDYFSATGQLWGNPVYDWERLAQTNFAWWVGRLRHLLQLVDMIRIDHFRGFESFWQVPQGEETAINGVWVPAPGEALFQTLQRELGELPILVEDLGVITPAVEALRDGFGLPGTKVLQFGFDDNPDNPYLPFNFRPNCVVYTGTHDNATTVAWYETLDTAAQQRVIRYLGYLSAQGIHWDLLRLGMASVAQWCIVPLQDVLGLGAEGRMNAPGSAAGNWEWRYTTDGLSSDLAAKLATLTRTYGRAHQPWPQPALTNEARDSGQSET
ncbi:4-alpha-glucanotransferase [Gloeomargarita lithophora Alchichica-D10]|uniref:4-alpha-glucanotransferase n=1 Tax=Gloeomargarita lithophora Alchichica-D10 TaxID=1188229 RepID=A0A1J0ACC4_9CYAN|nr:4-alpha-glucanotransferase [Gloeomargarita lithophora]APB33573.1 4-alpha-glucanotransferase [Gloeomargarita lithophora Alchichica-D10]